MRLVPHSPPVVATMHLEIHSIRLPVVVIDVVIDDDDDDDDDGDDDDDDDDNELVSKQKDAKNENNDDYRRGMHRQWRKMSTIMITRKNSRCEPVEPTNRGDHHAVLATLPIVVVPC